MTNRFYGAALLLISVVVIIIARTGNSVEEMEITPVLFTIPMGLYLLGITRSNMTRLLKKGVKMLEQGHTGKDKAIQRYVPSSERRANHTYARTQN